MLHFLPGAVRGKNLAPLLEQFILASVPVLFVLTSDIVLPSSEARLKGRLRESHSEVICHSTPSIPIPVSTKGSSPFLLCVLQTITFPAHNQKLMVHFYDSRPQREPQANFHSCFLPIPPLLTRIAITLCWLYL